MHVLDFLKESQNTEVSVTLLKIDCTADALTAISKIQGAYKGILAVESVFSIAIGG